MKRAILSAALVVVIALTSAITLSSTPSALETDIPGMQMFIALPDSSQPSGGRALSPLALPTDGTWWNVVGNSVPSSGRQQDAYLDNGDGVISVGDTLIIGGVPYPIAAVTPALWTRWSYAWSCPPYTYTCYDYIGICVWIPPEHYVLCDYPADNIFCECSEWSLYSLLEGESIWRLGGMYPPIGWDDNGDGVFSEGDLLWGRYVTGYHYWPVDVATVMIQTSDFLAVPSERTTWGALKKRYP